MSEVLDVTDGWYYVRIEDDPSWTIVKVQNGYVYWSRRSLPHLVSEVDRSRFISRVADPDFPKDGRADPAPETNRDIIDWFANGETGMSSKAMASAASGIEPTKKSHPYDPADLYRCIKLVDRVPTIREQFATIALMSPQWKAVIENWNLLRETFVAEVGEDWSNRNKPAKKTYKLMKSIGL